MPHAKASITLTLIPAPVNNGDMPIPGGMTAEPPDMEQLSL